MDQDKLKQIVEVLIFAADEPIPATHIKSFIDDANIRDIKKAVSELNLEYSNSNRSFSIVEVAGGYQMVSRDSYAPWLRKYFQKRIRSRLSQAALETLSVIAFKQPVSRTEVESVRGVNCDGVVRTLLDRKLITITGRADGPGRPLLYATTKEFLRYFGVNDLTDLPKPREIEEILKDDNVLPEDVAESVDLKELDLSKIAEDTTDSGKAEESEEKSENEPEENSHAPEPSESREKGDKNSRSDHAAE